MDAPGQGLSEIIEHFESTRDSIFGKITTYQTYCSSNPACATETFRESRNLCFQM